MNTTPEPLQSAIKPPYRVPTMGEIRARPLSSFRVVSTFSGGGGSSLGYRMAGLRVIWANEFIPAARDTYRANFPDTLLDERDIRAVTADEILNATGLARGELELLDGSPPCASFSAAGKGAKGWGKVKPYSDGARQVVDDLFFEYARVLDGLQPKVFVAENVKERVRGHAKGYFLLILARLRACGYRVEVRVVNAAWLGVPQLRERLIFLGVREDLDLAPAFPLPLPYRYTVREALAGLKEPVAPEQWMSGYRIGTEWRKLRPGGALIVFGKTDCACGGYLATAIHRLTMAGKLRGGAQPAEIIAKELSISGVQRPLPWQFLTMTAPSAVEVFRFGEFAGWVIEAPE